MKYFFYAYTFLNSEQFYPIFLLFRKKSTALTRANTIYAICPTNNTVFQTFNTIPTGRVVVLYDYTECSRRVEHTKKP